MHDDHVWHPAVTLKNAAQKGACRSTLYHSELHQGSSSKGALSHPTLVGRRFAHQRFADSRESIRRKIPIFEALGQIRANRVFSPIRSDIRAIRVQSSLLSHFLKGRFAKRSFLFEARIDSQRTFAIRMRIANRPTKHRTLGNSNMGIILR